MSVEKRVTEFTKDQVCYYSSHTFPDDCGTPATWTTDRAIAARRRDHCQWQDNSVVLARADPSPRVVPDRIVLALLYLPSFMSPNRNHQDTISSNAGSVASGSFSNAVVKAMAK